MSMTDCEHPTWDFNEDGMAQCWKCEKILNFKEAIHENMANHHADYCGECKRGEIENV